MIPCHRATGPAIPSFALTRWSPQVDPLADAKQRYWLTRAGALTAGLRTLGILSLRVLRESVDRPRPDERAAMQLSGYQAVRVREICMAIDGHDCVVARSVVEASACNGSWQAIRGLGARPLADILYDDRRVMRSAFETSRLRLPHPLARLAVTASGPTEQKKYHAYWARRSVFWRDRHALLVAECFLPAFWELLRT